MKEVDYERPLDLALGARIRVKFDPGRREVFNYAVMLLIESEGDLKTVRLYDGAHAVNDLHRYTAEGGKQPAEVFHHGTLGEGMRAAIAEIERGYEAMIEAWQKR